MEHTTHTNDYPAATQTPEALMTQLHSRMEGLTEVEVERARAEYGLNTLNSHNKRSALAIFASQWTSPFILVLLGACVISIFLKEYIDAITIIAILLFNNILSFFQEYHSENTVEKLQSIVPDNVLVRRKNEIVSIDRNDVVQGDIFIAKPGAIVPADVRWVVADKLEMNESALTGESVGVIKSVDANPEIPTNTMGLAGTHVVEGYGEGLVVATGERSTLGKIINLTASAKRVSAFQQNLARLSKFILWLVIITLVIVFTANIFLKGADELFPQLLFSIALAVSVIPEALPAVITITFTKGAMALAKKKVIVRRLAAIEDLGQIQVLCTDKTGTITQNVMTLTEVHSTHTDECVKMAALALEADSTDRKHASALSFDDAIIRFSTHMQKELAAWKTLWSVPFDPERKRTTNVVRHGSTIKLVTKGAPETVLELCTQDMHDQSLTKSKKHEILEQAKHLGTRGFRVLAVAYAPTRVLSEGQDYKEERLTYCGLLAFADPLKDTAKKSIAQAQALGVQVKILTGDSPEVARAVAMQVGIIGAHEHVLTGDEFDALSSSERHARVRTTHVFARVRPEQKFSIIQHLQQSTIVGFLGEGMNDAPALRLAHVGLVVHNASDIAREAADILLLDRSLHVIVDGIIEGRRIFANISKYIRYTLIGNFGNFFAIAGISILIPFLPMLPTQILLTNLLTDLPLIAVATDHVEREDVRKPHFFSIREIAVMGLALGFVSSLFDFIFFAAFYENEPAVVQTMWFIVSILTELLLVFSIRTRKVVIFSKLPAPVLTTLTISAAIITVALPFIPFTRNLFHFILPTAEWMVIGLMIAGGYVVATEMAKAAYYRFANHS